MIWCLSVCTSVCLSHLAPRWAQRFGDRRIAARLALDSNGANAGSATLSLPFLCFLCICVLVLYLLVVTAASIDGCLCLAGSLPLFSCMLVLIVF